ncbi:MAG: FtsW/RodA/SpoVE family cell cycle protein [Elusimicrobia bacterium]|nr:FtsW/RodA/SpoVE family cell cycle protein [Elusimicrobiota bacterium]
MSRREFISPVLVGRTEGVRPPVLYRLFGVDVPLLSASGLLFGLGTLLVYTALHGSSSFESLWIRQIVALTTGSVIGFFIALIPGIFILETSPFFYLTSLVFLLLVLAIGKIVHGSRSWIDLGPFNFQPSEMAKFATILYLSYLGARWHERGPIVAWSQILIFGGVIAVPLALVLAQNDLSSALSFIFIGVIYAWMLDILSGRWIAVLGLIGLGTFLSLLAHIISGLQIAEIAALPSWLLQLGFGAGLSSWKLALWAFVLMTGSLGLFRFLKGIFFLPPRTTILWPVVMACSLYVCWGAGWAGWRGLKTYQKNRIASFLFPKADTLGSGYNVTQSKIAIGSGGVMGRGLLSGSQTSLGFLPERHTDFAFAALGEETGFIGCAGVMALLAVFFWRLSRFLEMARDQWERLVVAGLFGMWLGEMAINIAYVLGMFPILGIGLPFLSYGSTRLVMNLIETGVLLSISRGFYVYR